MNETTCVNCGYVPMGNLEEANVCILCGSTLCEHCYDESSYCKACTSGDQEVHSGECVECGRTVTALNAAGVCEGCVLDAQVE